MDDHEHLAQHLQDVGEGQERDVGVVVGGDHVEAESEGLEGVEEVPLGEHDTLRNAFSVVCVQHN